MPRFPAFVTALGVHTAVFVTLIVVPVFTPEPLPEPGLPPPLLPTWPLRPRVAIADAPRVAGPARTAGPKRMLASATRDADDDPAPLPVFDLEGPPTDNVADVPIDIAAFGTNPDDGGAGRCCPSASADDPPGGGLGEPAERPVRIGGDARPPTKLRHVAPRYPDLALRARVSGTVEIDCLIDETGRVTSLRVLSGHPLLAPAAADAVRQWAYSPTRLNGRAVAILMSVSVRFELQR